MTKLVLNLIQPSVSMSQISIKNPEAQQKMRVAGKLAAEVLEMIGSYVKPGISTGELDRICHRYILERGAIPAPLNYKGFPKSICTSVNHVICHGIPSDSKTLKEGDIINIDITVIKDGYHGDTSKMFSVGKISPLADRLIKVTREALFLGIEQVKPGKHLGDIGNAIETLAKKERFSVVREYCGHGIGLIFHEEPQVLHYGKPGTREEIVEGMTFTIEPMLNAGKADTRLLPDDWTVVTRDKKLSAQWEHTLLVTASGVEILTLREEEK
jgi:methionyl aminopeptidase